MKYFVQKCMHSAKGDINTLNIYFNDVIAVDLIDIYLMISRFSDYLIFRDTVYADMSEEPNLPIYLLKLL